MNMLLCAMDKMSKAWGGAPIFKNMSLEIQEGDRIGMVGPNGCGKTTLLKLLAGIETPDSGAVHYKKGSQTALLDQIPHYEQEISVREVLQEAFESLRKIQKRMSELEALMTDSLILEKILQEYGVLQDAFAALGGYEMDSNMFKVVNGLGISQLLDNKFGHLSGGERTKVCLAHILLLKPDLLLLDEPTNHLDLNAVEWLESYLQDYKGGVLVVSHDRYFLDRVVTKVFDMEGGVIDVYHGNYSTFVEEKERNLLLEFATYQEQQKKIKKMEEAIKRLRVWAAQADNPKMFKRAAAMQKALDRMDKLNRPILERKKMGLTFEAGERSGNDVVQLEHVGKSFHRNGESRILFDNVNMLVRFKDCAAIVGENGSGKSTLLKIITSSLKPDSGSVKIGSSLKVGYLAQQDGFDDEEITVLDAYRQTAMVEEGEARHQLAKFLFYGASVFRKLKSLSGGERMRLRLAQLMMQDINVLLLDEPTNHLDIDSREALEDTLKEFSGTIVCVSHDRYFLNKLFDVTYWLEHGKLTQYAGRYDEARIKREELNQTLRSKQAENIHKNPARDKTIESERKTLVSNDISSREKKLAKLEADIAVMERKIALLDEAMLVEQDSSRLFVLHSEKMILESERELLYQQWGTMAE
ncbi:ribosomal protection-like ABC-F family protein [Paenibacillus sp. UNC451MF]|uniref:ribosomal protection-like ABC-F family protein n=1 Tax=Paenibacillus sp. UNC451MF TaxID=1449063 RepID=UPI0009DD542C|nr:ABC-F family ATP-binding cassette domain-containing protein [Paenibacillus sp. UNC451MF]